MLLLHASEYFVLVSSHLSGQCSVDVSRWQFSSYPEHCSTFWIEHTSSGLSLTPSSQRSFRNALASESGSPTLFANHFAKYAMVTVMPRHTSSTPPFNPRRHVDR
eukprot:gene15152-biopygen15227